MSSRSSVTVLASTSRPPQETEVNRRDVEEMVSDWKRRLEELISIVEKFRAKYASDFAAERFDVEQVDEYLMRTKKIKPGKLPACRLVKGDTCITFVPSALWIIGAKGRVNVSAGKNQFTLFDMGGEQGKPSNWQVVSRDFEKVLVPFNADAFKRIIGGQIV